MSITQLSHFSLDKIEQQPVKKERSSNLELYRIIVMLLIVSHHYVVNSGLLQVLQENPLCSNSIFYYFFGAWGKTGINCFVLITGYFMCMSNITLRKFLKLYLWVITYGILFSIIFALVGCQAITIESLLVLFPVRIIHSDSFTQSFIVWWLSIPFLNVLINNLKRIQHLLLLILCFIIFSIYPSIPRVIEIQINPICWFSTLYIIASYIRKYPEYVPKESSSLFWGWMSVASFALGLLSIVGILVLNNKMGTSLPQYYMLSDSQQPLALFISVATFLWFKSIKLKNNKIINTIAASSFGVLLIHSNSAAMRQWLWEDLIDCVGHYDANFYWLYAVGCVLAIYAVCTIIDIIRIKTIETSLLNVTERFYMNIYNKFNKK